MSLKVFVIPTDYGRFVISTGARGAEWRNLRFQRFCATRRN